MTRPALTVIRTADLPELPADRDPETVILAVTAAVVWPLLAAPGDAVVLRADTARVTVARRTAGHWTVRHDAPFRLDWPRVAAMGDALAPATALDAVRLAGYVRESGRVASVREGTLKDPSPSRVS